MQRVFQESTELKFVWWFIGQCIYFLSLHPKRIHSEGIKPSFSDKTNGLQLLKPYTRVLVLLTYLTKRTYSICFKFRGVFLCDFVEFQFLQAHSRLEIGGIAKSVRESCLVTEKHIGFHHFSQHSLAVMVSFNSNNPDIHDSFFLAQ